VSKKASFVSLQIDRSVRCISEREMCVSEEKCVSRKESLVRLQIERVVRGVSEREMCVSGRAMCVSEREFGESSDTGW